MSTAARGRAKSRRRRAPARGSSRPARGKRKGGRGGRGRSRSKSRRGPAAARVKRRRLIAGGVVVAVLAGVGITQLVDVDDAIREVTLPLQYDSIIVQQAEEKGVDAALIAAVIYAESRFDATEVSEADARGLMQITPETANEIEQKSGGTTFDPDTDLADPQINIQYGTFWLDHLLDLYDGEEVAALAAYNAGQGNVEEWGGAGIERDDIEFEETRTYVETVLTKRDEYRENYARELGLE